MMTGVTRVGPFAQRWTERGVGPRVLLLHGIYAGANGDEWAHLVPHLRTQRAVRVPDLLGCGASDRPDLEYTPEVVLAAVETLIRDAGRDVHVVASSLTAAYAVRAIAQGGQVSRLTLITPTGLGRAQTRPVSSAGRLLYSLGRHTPLGDLLTLALDDTEVKQCEPDVLWAGADGFSPKTDAQAWTDARAHVVIFEGVGLPQAEVPEIVADLIVGDWRREPVGRIHSDRPDVPR